jgi:hypothetical protein
MVPVVVVVIAVAAEGVGDRRGVEEGARGRSARLSFATKRVGSC